MRVAAFEFLYWLVLSPSGSFSFPYMGAAGVNIPARFSPCVNLIAQIALCLFLKLNHASTMRYDHHHHDSTRNCSLQVAPSRLPSSPEPRKPFPGNFALAAAACYQAGQVQEAEVIMAPRWHAPAKAVLSNWMGRWDGGGGGGLERLNDC